LTHVADSIALLLEFDELFWRYDGHVDGGGVRARVVTKRSREIIYLVCKQYKALAALDWTDEHNGSRIESSLKRTWSPAQRQRQDRSFLLLPSSCLQMIDMMAACGVLARLLPNQYPYSHSPAPLSFVSHPHIQERRMTTLPCLGRAINSLTRRS
jgi:hypothetical protein